MAIRPTRINVIYKPHAKQRELHADPHRFKVAVCGRRFGKSTFALNETFLRSLEKPGRYWIVGPTYRQVKSIYWRDLVGRWVPFNSIKKKNEAELFIELINGSVIELKGADNENTLRGAGIAGVVLDEYAAMKPHVWPEIIRPMVIDSGGWALFMGTPLGAGDHFHRLAKIGDWNNVIPTVDLVEGKDFTKDPDFITYHFTTYDNPHLRQGEIDKIKQELPEATFAQEMLADFRQYKGLVYKEFDPKIHVIDPLIVEPSWTKYRTIDFGFHNPFVCLFVAIDYDGNVIVYDEIYRKGLPTAQQVELIRQKSLGWHFTATFGDRSAKQLMADFAKYGIQIQPGNNDVQGGIQKVAEYLHRNPVTGKPRLQIFSTCKNLIREFGLYRREVTEEEVAEGGNVRKITKEEPVKEHDHALDALRYLLFTLATGTKERQEQDKLVLELMAARARQEDWL